MSGREAVLGAIRRSLGVTGREPDRQAAIRERLADHPAGIIPARGQRDAAGRVALFAEMAERAHATVARLGANADIPAAVAEHLRRHNLPSALRRGTDPRLAALPWESAPHLILAVGPSDGSDFVSLSHAEAGVAETGTLVLPSGPDNPTTLSFLAETHLVVLRAEDVVGDYESVWARLRLRYGEGVLPRTVNFITGPSRSADIEQTLLLGAHGPRRLHILLIGTG